MKIILTTIATGTSNNDMWTDIYTILTSDKFTEFLEWGWKLSSDGDAWTVIKCIVESYSSYGIIGGKPKKLMAFGAGSETKKINEINTEFIFIPKNPSLYGCFFECLFHLFPQYTEFLIPYIHKFITENKIKKGKVSKLLINKWNSLNITIMNIPIKIQCVKPINENTKYWIIKPLDSHPIVLYIYKNHYCLLKNLHLRNENSNYSLKLWIEAIQNSYNETELKINEVLDYTLNEYKPKVKFINSWELLIGKDCYVYDIETINNKTNSL